MITYNSQNAMQWSRASSRKAVGSVMGDLAASHPELMVLTADFASSAGLNDYAAQYPEQFLNVGIAEQNMIGVASGLALGGNNVFAFSFAPFASMRCFEAIRSHVGYMGLNVKIVGIGSGIGLGYQGNTHYGLEDVALMRTIPGMTVISPADCSESVKAVEALMDFQGPAYLRLTGSVGNPPIYKEDYSFTIGKGITLKQGSGVAIIAAGPCVYESMRAARLLSKKGIDATIVDMHTIKPLDEELIRQICKEHALIVTVEEHTRIGGLGSAIAEFLVDEGLSNRVLRLGLPDAFGKVRTYSALMAQYGLQAQGIFESITRIMESGE